MNHVRFLANVTLTVEYKGGAPKKLDVPSGRFLPAQKLIENEDGTLDVYLHDGGILRSVDRTAFSVQGQLPVERYVKKIVAIKQAPAKPIDPLLSPPKVEPKVDPKTLPEIKL